MVWEVRFTKCIHTVNCALMVKSKIVKHSVLSVDVENFQMDKMYMVQM